MDDEVKFHVCVVCRKEKHPLDFSIYLDDSPYCICDDCVLEVYEFLKPLCERLLRQKSVKVIHEKIVKDLKEGN